MPVRVKPPPAETGDTISPGCASFEIATPLNGARMTVLSSAVCCSATWLAATLICSRVDASAGDQRVDLGLRLVDLGGRREPVLAELLLAPKRRPALRRAGPRFPAPRGAPPRAAPAPAPAPRATVESSRRASTWPSRTAMPSSTFTSIDLAGDLRRDRGAPPRGDVARGVQHRRLRAGRTLRDGRDLDFDRPLARLPEPAAAGAAAQDDQKHQPLDPAPVGRAQRLALDAQRGEVVNRSSHSPLLSLTRPNGESNLLRIKSESQPRLVKPVSARRPAASPRDNADEDARVRGEVAGRQTTGANHRSSGSIGYPRGASPRLDAQLSRVRRRRS